MSIHYARLDYDVTITDTLGRTRTYPQYAVLNQDAAIKLALIEFEGKRLEAPDEYGYAAVIVVKLASEA